MPAMSAKSVTHKELMAFARRLGEAEYRSKLNYFRIMEYPLALTLLDVQPGMSVLEVGSGFISLPPLWLAAERGARVTAVDREPYTAEHREHIETLMKRVAIAPEALRIVSADARQLPFADGAFDRISAVSALEHLDLFTDAYVARELGRVLKPGGRFVFTVPFNLGKHIENEDWGGEGYEQRHYTDATLSERLIHPSGLHFVDAIAFGETDPATGKKVLAMPDDERRRFAEKAGKNPAQYWREYFRADDDQFVVHRSLLPDWVLRASGLIAVVLEKRDAPLSKSYFLYDPLASFAANEKLARQADNSPYWLSIDQVRVENLFGDEVSVFESGESCRVLISFTCHGEVEDPAFRVLFHDESDKVVAGLHVARSGERLGKLTGKHVLEVHFGMLNLVGGPYRLTVGAWDRDLPDPIPPVAYDLHVMRYAITVNDRKRGLAGVAYTPYAIRLE